jgi:histidinol-phosphate aminotransferase
MAPSFVRPSVRAMRGYTPGEQPPIGARVVKLNTNENPFPPSPKVMQAIREVEAEVLRRYPAPLADAFRSAAAKAVGNGITPDMIMAGNGSDDVLTVATRTFLPPGGTLAYPDPTYSLYPVLAQIEEAKTAPVPWEKNWQLPIDDLLSTKADAIYLANPNAPSGTLVKPDVVAELASKFEGLLLIDEAYADFADANCLELVSKFENVVISRTLSKAYSLAGLRFGYAVAQPHVIDEMVKVKDSYNTDAISIIAATAAVSDREYAAMTWKHVKDERARVTKELESMGFDVIPSQTNFVLAGVPGGDGRAFYSGLKSQGILVRYFDLPGLRDKIRITIGTAQENNAVLGGLSQIRSADKAA